MSAEDDISSVLESVADELLRLAASSARDAVKALPSSVASVVEPFFPPTEQALRAAVVWSLRHLVELAQGRIVVVVPSSAEPPEIEVS